MKEQQNDLFPGPQKGERIVEIDVARLKTFDQHPFRVCADQDMDELMESIRTYGIISPLIVRPTLDGNYEIISGHRRKFAAEKLGFYKVPVVIRVMEDTDSVICMVDSNLQREKILPSEKAAAYKLKNDALKRKGGKFSKHDNSQIVQRAKYRKTVEEIGALGGDSARQVGRYIRLTFLRPELLRKVDEGEMGFNTAVAISFLKENEQNELLEAMEFVNAKPSLSQAQRLKILSREGNFTKEKAIEIISEIKKGETERVVFKNEQIKQFFPKDYTSEQIKRRILEILTALSAENGEV